MTVHDSKFLPAHESVPALPASDGAGSGAHPAPVSGGPPAGKKSHLVSLLVWLVVLGLLAVVCYFAYRYYEQSQNPGKAKRGSGPVPVVVAKSTVGNMKIYIDRIGTVNAYNTVTLRTRVDGELEKVAFTEGQMVKAGQLLFQIDPRPYQVQLVQAEGQMAKDQATLQNARVDLKRYEDAAAAVSEQMRITAAATVKSDEGLVKADQGAIDSANLNLKYCTITAPISGRIGLRAVDVGNMVHATDTNGMAVINVLQPISVLFSPAQDELPTVQKAMAEHKDVVVEAWDSVDQTKLATGKVEALQNQIDPTTGTFTIKAVFPNKDNALYPNQFVNAHILVQTLENVVLVPDASVQTDANDNPFVYVVTPQNTVAMQMVTVGPAQHQETVIETGLKGGEEVVTAGFDKLEPKSKVTAHFAEESATQSAAASEPATGEAPGAATKSAAGAGGASHGKGAKSGKHKSGGGAQGSGGGDQEHP